MGKYTCQSCLKDFDQKSHYERHLQRKRPCKIDSNIELKVNNVLLETKIGIVHLRPYSSVKEFVDKTLNKDKNTFITSNDEPTPIDCVEEMVSAVPDSFWKQKELKILDPCCGNGNFHTVIAEKLRTHGYSVSEITNSLYFNDINEIRLKNVIELFGSSSKITKVDFLKSKCTDLYDMIVMNPPYAKIMEDGKRASKNHGLSTSFLKHGIESLKPGGFLVAIVPDSWMSLSDRNDFCGKITEYQFVTLNIHCAKKWFPKIGSTFTWFVIQKVPASTPFEVSYLHAGKTYTSLVNPQVRSYIPLRYSNIIQSIFEKTVDNDSLEKFQVETSSNLHRYTQRALIRDEMNDEFKYKLIHTPKQTVWANRPHKFQDGWKVFISTTDKYGVFADNCGMTQSIAFIRVENEEQANNIVHILLHPLYVFINNCCRYGNFNNIRVLQRFPVCFEDPYKKFGLTKDEIDFISSQGDSKTLAS